MKTRPSTSQAKLISAFVLPLVLMAGGWLWARMALSRFQAEAGSMALDHLPLAGHYHRWAINIPHGVTLVAMGLALVPAAVASFPRRSSLISLGLYALLLLLVSGFVFVGFEFEAFD